MGWHPDNLDYYHRCLWILRHANKAQAEKRIAFGGRHYPTMIVTNHREPAMKMPPQKRPPTSRWKYANIPMQTFQDTQSFYQRRELEVPYHFVVPYFDVNIGNIIKNQGSMN